MNYIKFGLLVGYIACNFLYESHCYVSKAMLKGKNIQINRNTISSSSVNPILGRNFTKLSNLDIKRFQKSSNLSFDKFSKDELEAVRDYTVIDYKKVNQYLQGSKVRNESKIKRKIDSIDSAISKYKLEEDIIVYRGTNRDYYKNVKVDMIL